MDLIIFEYNYFFLFSVLFLFALIYFLVKRFIIWGMEKNLYRLFSYLTGSLLFLNLFFVLLLFSNQIDRAAAFLPFFIQVIAMFGIFSLIGSGIHFLWKRTLKKA